MRPLLIGLEPSKNSKHSIALGGAIGSRLSKWAGVESIHYHFDTINLNKKKQKKFDHLEANQIKAEILRTSLPNPWILCGRKVAGCFDKALMKAPYWKWQFGVVVIPHPSGRCRIYNDLKARKKTGAILRSLIKKESHNGSTKAS